MCVFPLLARLLFFYLFGFSLVLQSEGKSLVKMLEPREQGGEVTGARLSFSHTLTPILANKLLHALRRIVLCEYEIL